MPVRYASPAMTRFSGWGIRTRLLLAFVGVLLPYSALVGLGVGGFRILWQRIGATQEEVVTETKAAAELQVAFLQLVMPANDYLITGDPAERVEFERRLQRVHGSLTKLEGIQSAHPQERRALEQVRSQLLEIETLSRSILAAPRTSADHSLVDKMKTLDRAGDEVADTLGRFWEASERGINERIERAKTLVRSLALAGVGLLVLSVGGGGALAWLFAAWLGRPIQAIARGSRRMAGGDLSQRVATNVGGELGEAAWAFNEMAERIQQRNRQIATLHIAARSLATEHDPATLFQEIVDTAQELIGARYAALAVSGRDGGIRTVFTAGSRAGPTPAPHRGAEDQERLERLIRGGALEPALGDAGQSAVDIGAPIRFREEILGALYLSGKLDGFTEDDASLLTTLCADAAVALKNALLFDEIEAQRARLGQIFESTSEAVISADSQGRIVAWNSGARRIFGYSEDEVLNRSLTLLMPERYREAHSRALQRAAVASAPPLAGRVVELHGLRKDGTEFPLDLSLSRWTLRQETFFSGIIRDITARKQVEQMKSDFVSFATHQLRTPLSGIKWLLELASEVTEVPEETRVYIQDARESAERLIQLVDDLLNVSRMEGGRLTLNPAETALCDVTRSVLGDLETLIHGKNHHVSVEEIGRVPSVLVDPQLFRQVILNLVSNAVKYTPAGGEIAVMVCRRSDEIHWVIRDTGIGIPRDAQQRLFEKFFRADNAVVSATEGTGLGLHLARLIVERHGGRIWCESEEGQGATFAFALPLGEGIA